MGPELALAASAREWPDTIHRFLVDHGGGRVRSRVMGPDQALADEFDVLIIDDICSFLNPRLVRRLRSQGKEIVGVFSPSDGPDAKRRLLECGISDVIEANATPDEFLALVASTVTHRAVRESSDFVTPRACLIGVFGTPGTGVTEIAIALSNYLAARDETVLVDLDVERPGLAQRLDLPLLPNLKTAIDFAHHDEDRIRDAIHVTGSMALVTGLPTPGTVSVPEIRALVMDLSGAGFAFVVLDLGDHVDLIEPDSLDIAIAVGSGTPIGLTRLIHHVSDLARGTGRPELLAVVNRVPTRSRRADEIKRELARALDGVPVVTIGTDRQVERAAWDGVPLSKGYFARSTGRIGKLISSRGVG